MSSYSGFTDLIDPFPFFEILTLTSNLRFSMAMGRVMKDLDVVILFTSLTLHPREPVSLKEFE